VNLKTLPEADLRYL